MTKEEKLKKEPQNFEKIITEKNLEDISFEEFMGIQGGIPEECPYCKQVFLQTDMKLYINGPAFTKPTWVCSKCYDQYGENKKTGS